MPIHYVIRRGREAGYPGDTGILWVWRPRYAWWGREAGYSGFSGNHVRLAREIRSPNSSSEATPSQTCDAEKTAMQIKLQCDKNCFSVVVVVHTARFAPPWTSPNHVRLAEAQALAAKLQRKNMRPRRNCNAEKNCLSSSSNSEATAQQKQLRKY